ncbi:hypothetical protein [Cognatiyoonia koreensis]|nr:hypothetical protein [Cognatiyoonia koreensis]
MTPANAQDEGGLRANLTFSTGLTASDTDDSGLRTDLGFGITSETRTQTFAATALTGIVASFEDDETLGLDNPNLRLSYGIESRQVAVNTTLTYARTDVDSLIATDVADILVIDEGTRETVGAALGLTFGREAPFGGEVNLSYRDLRYADTVDPDLIDETTTTAAVNLRFDIDQTVTATLGYSISEEDTDSGNDTRRERLTLGAVIAVSPSLDVNVSAGLSQITTDENSATSVVEGGNYGLGLTQARPNGAIRFALSSDLSENGRRTTATLGRDYETPGGTLMADIGLTQGSDDTLRPLYKLSYSNELARARYSVSLDQGFATTNDGNEALNSRFAFTWQQDLTRTSRFGSDISYQMTNVLGQDDDTDRLRLGMRYSQDIAEDWALTARYTHTVINESGSSTTRENELFLGIETTLEWRP